MTFIKNKENFVCENCGEQIQGNGYTNHCSKCLWSKHIDINPGDRAADCGGMMEPIFLNSSSDKFSITHKCVKCGYEKRNIASNEDDTDILIDLGKY